ncbi:MAG: DMT family transporter [Nannocystaceae bacterium]
MTFTTGIIFALCSSLSWAGLDIVRKQLATKIPTLALAALLSLGQAPAFGIWWAITGGEIGSVDYFLPASAGLALNIAANILFLMAMRASPFSVSIPFLSFTPVFSAILAIPLLDELPTGTQVAGIGAVVIGAIVITSDGARGDEGETIGLWRAFLHERGAVYMTLVALCWSATSVLDKLATSHASLPIHALVMNCGVGVLLALFLVATKRGGEFRGARQHPTALVIGMLVGGAAFAFQLLAIQGLLVGVVETIKRAVGLLVALIVGRMAFGETVTTPRIIGAVFMGLGTALIVW